MTSFTLERLAREIDAELIGEKDKQIRSIATIQTADTDQITFLANKSYVKYLETTQAGAVILAPEHQDVCKTNMLLCDNPYLAYAKLSHLWERNLFAQVEQNINPSAQIHPSAQIGEGCQIGAGVVIEEGVKLGARVFVGPNATIGADSVVGDETIIHAGVHIYHGVAIGCSCVIHSGVVIGSDGFGFAPSANGWHKIAQLGGVEIGDRVEIGANTAIDRGALDNTVIESGVILDNQIQIAHNVRIGQNTAIAACSAIAGSTTIGKNVIIGGASGIAGHLTIADGVHITAMTMVIKSLSKPGVYSSGTGVQPNDQWRKSIARLRQLDKLATRVKTLEKQFKSIEPQDRQ